MKQNPFSLEGKTILVTGASSGIGRQTAVSISSFGGTVVAGGRNEQRLEATMGMLEGTGHQAVVADLVDSEQRRQMAEACPVLDGVVHSAGILRMIPLRVLSEKVFRDVVAINVEAPLCLTRDLVRKDRLRQGGSIVCVSSVIALRAVTAQAVYGASKAALEAAARVMALELAPRRIRCNCLCPGTVRTPMLDRNALTAEQGAHDEATYPLGYGEPEDVANAAVFLLSSASRWITGTSIVLDGGHLSQA